MNAMDLRTLRTACFFVPERCADHDADRDTAGKPYAHVSSDHPEYRTQRRSQRDTQSMQFRFVRHNRSPAFRLPAIDVAEAESRKPISDPSLRLRLIAGLQRFVTDLPHLAQQLRQRHARERLEQCGHLR